MEAPHVVPSPDEPADVVATILSRVADRRDVDPAVLTPLGDVIDPTMLRTFATTDAVTEGSELRFEYEGLVVSVAGDGGVRLIEPPRRPEQASGESP